MLMRRCLVLVLLVSAVSAPAAAMPMAGEGVGRAADPIGGAVRPVPGVVVRPFDPPAHPYGPGHRGVDLAAAAGEDIRSALAGTVAFSGVVAGVGWVTIDHGGGLVTTYGPLEDRVPYPTAVRAGDVIGRLADGDIPQHLDWGARLHGEYIEPMLLLSRWRLRLTALDRVPIGEHREVRDSGSGPPEHRPPPSGHVEPPP